MRNAAVSPLTVALNLHARIRGTFAPSPEAEDAERQRFLLRTVLTVSLALSVICFAAVLTVWLRLGNAYRGVAWWVPGLVVLCVAGLLQLTERGWLRVASAGLFIVYLTPSLYASARWGIDLPQALLLDAFLIVMTSVLFGTRSALLLSAGLSLTLFIFAWLGTRGILPVNRYWHHEAFTLWDGVSITATLLCVALLCRLANEEIARSLARARASERLLRAERDLLEVRVEERTQELRRTQLEKMTQMHRFVEFGRHAAGFFHDLASPLNALALNLELMREDARRSENAQLYLKRAVAVTGRLESFLKDVRRQVQDEEPAMTDFSIDEIVGSVLAIMEGQARKAGVRIVREGTEGAAMFGNPVGFYKILANLVGNAIDAYHGVARTEDRTVTVRLLDLPDRVTLEVVDRGTGMPADRLQRIWEPFFTTKPADRGMGIGLSIVKRIVEREFRGSVACVSEEGRGTTFTVHLPRHARRPEPAPLADRGAA